MAQNFRERALRNTGRELENTVLLLAHHFDQQSAGFRGHPEAISSTTSARPASTLQRTIASASPAQDVHRMLRSKIEALPYMGGVNVIDADGNLINSSTAWPAPKVNVADRAYFRTFKYDPHSPDVLIEPVHSRISGAWTILIVRKIAGTERRVPGRRRPRHRAGQLREVLRDRRARRRRNDLDAASRRHAARPLSPCPARLMGRNFKTGSFEQQRIFGPRSLRRPLHQPRRRRGPADLVARPAPLSDPDDGDHDARGGARRTGASRSAS